LDGCEKRPADLGQGVAEERRIKSHQEACRADIGDRTSCETSALHTVTEATSAELTQSVRDSLEATGGFSILHVKCVKGTRCDAEFAIGERRLDMSYQSRRCFPFQPAGSSLASASPDGYADQYPYHGARLWLNSACPGSGDCVFPHPGTLLTGGSASRTRPLRLSPWVSGPPLHEKAPLCGAFSLVAQQHLQPLGAPRQVGAVHLRVAPRAGPAPGGQVLVSLRTLPGLRSVVPCSSLLHQVSEPPRNRVPLSTKPSGSAAAQTSGG
jgi:hypothetical protein